MRVWRGAIVVFMSLGAAAIAAAAFVPDGLTTGSIGPAAQALPVRGTVSQAGRIVGIATGAKLGNDTIAFDEIADARLLQPGADLDFAGYRVSIVRVRLVRYTNGDPAAGTALEEVVARIKTKPAK